MEGTIACKASKRIRLRGWSVGLGVGVSVKATLHPAPSPVFKGFPGDFYALGVGVDKVSSYSMLFER